MSFHIPLAKLSAAAAVAAVLLTAPLRAQAPAVNPSSDPTKKNVPAEIVTSAPPSTPPPGQKTVETSAPALPLSPGSKAPASGAESPARQGADALSEAELDQVITLIKERYISPGALSDIAVKRATVQGLLERLGASATLVLPGTVGGKPASAFRSEVLDEQVGYIRLGTFDDANLQQLDQAIGTFKEKGIEAWVIDLRATPPAGDFERAAEVCRRFCPKGKVLFTLRRAESKQSEIFTTKEDPKVHGLLAVLTDSETEGSAEIVAGTLRALANAVIIGQKTKGAAAEFMETPLKEGRILRLAVAEVLLPGEKSLVPEGLKPDVAVDVSKDVEEDASRTGTRKRRRPICERNGTRSAQ